MPKSPAILLIALGFLLFLSRHETAQAESAHDRVALMLSGSGCPSIRQPLTTDLQSHPAVLHVEPDLIPDHVLVDLARERLTQEELAAIVNEVIGGRQCHAEIMKSCISAEPPSRHFDSAQPAAEQAHSH